MKVTSINVSVTQTGRYRTSIYFIDSTGNLDMVERTDLHLQGVEEFIRDFRIKHKL